MILTDSAGNLLAVKVFEADFHDGPRAFRWWQTGLSGYPLFEAVSVIKGDHHFGGKFKEGVETGSSVRVEVMKVLVEKRAQPVMPVHKGRWVVERTIAWVSNSRRRSRDYERLPEHSEAFIIISPIQRLLKHPICHN